ncbi:unnamed protein product [Clonostachys chloroleuca]|uniref:Uncharacterized protein n=1 Tax=Clonostachys chloroleuca TaxID=1926264 RepID=A0AA35M9W1_9HYPO|nr:unnamed protein product [Clonostachys chloroleuca]
MRPTEVFTYAMLGLAGSVAAQVDSSQDDNGLVARSRIRHGSALTNIIKGGRSPGIANMRVRKMFRSVSDQDEHQLEARSPIRSIIKAPTYATSRRGRGRRSVSDDDEHQLETRSPIRGFKPFVPVPISKPIKYKKRSEDDEHQLDTRSPIRGFKVPVPISKPIKYKKRSEDDELFERRFDAEEFEEEY